jgi:uncharacterized protein YdaU (DUF1376 family)
VGVGAGGVNFIRLYIGDYMRDTGALTVAEHGAYFLMLLNHYATEKPLPQGRDLHRLLRAETKAEREAIESVTAKFWAATPEGLVNVRAGKEMTRAEHQREVNRTVGKMGGRPKRIETEPVSESVSESEPNDNPNQTPDNHKEKIEKTNTPRKRGAAARLVPVETLIDEGVAPQHASDWLTARARKSLPLTPTAWEQVKVEAKKAGLSVPEAIKTAAGMGWAGFKASWTQADSRTGAPLASDQFAGAI